MPQKRVLTALTDEERAQAMARFQIIRPFLEEGIPLSRLAREQEIPLRTAQQWVARYRRNGLAGLIRQPRADQGIRRRVNPELQLLIEGLALQRPPPTAAAIHRRIVSVAAERGWPIPSYRTVAALIQQLDPALVTLAHQGTKAYKETFDLLYRRDASRPNEIWQADHTLLDIWVLNERGQPSRPWLTVILDDYSRAVAGYLVSFQAPSALQTALAFRQAIWRKSEAHWHVCGIPDIFYTDHGSDFTSRHIEQLSADLKVQLIFSECGEPRGRGKIERFFQTVNQLFLCELPGYTPPHTTPATAQLTVMEFDRQLRSFLLDRYHQRIHSETNMAPQARWDAAAFLPQLPESLEQLDLLLLTVAKPRRVQQDGIRFQGFRYLDLTLAAYVGEQVTIRYDPRDMAEIRVYHQNTFVCRAVCQELAEQTISLKEIIQTRNRRRRQLREQLSERHTAVDLLLEVHRDALPADEPEPAAPSPRLKRYYND